MANAAIGSRISLISKSDIRYEGQLDFINTQENHVGLKNVRMLGTEGRKNGVGEVNGSDALYEFIIFRGGDIKDLSVFENQPRDPAIVSQGNRTQNAAPAANNNNQRGGGGGGNHWAQGPPRNNNNNGNISNNNRGGGGGGGGRAGGRGGQQQQRPNFGDNRPVFHTGQDFNVSHDPSQARKALGGDFDFNKARIEFERTKEEARAKKQSESGGSKYHKNDFFDELTTDDKEKARGGPPMDYLQRRAERENQNAQDTETFGANEVAQQSTRGFTRRGRGGRGGGGGRGGNNNNNNNNNVIGGGGGGGAGGGYRGGNGGGYNGNRSGGRGGGGGGGGGGYTNNRN